jgi:hypothetical protein
LGQCFQKGSYQVIRHAVRSGKADLTSPIDKAGKRLELEAANQKLAKEPLLGLVRQTGPFATKQRTKLFIVIGTHTLVWPRKGPSVHMWELQKRGLLGTASKLSFAAASFHDYDNEGSLLLVLYVAHTLHRAPCDFPRRLRGTFHIEAARKIHSRFIF